MNKAPDLPLTVDLMGELVKNNELGCKVADEGFKGPALDPSSKKGGMPSNRVPSICCGYCGGNGNRGWRCCHVGGLDDADDAEGECGEAGGG
jgi:hypothetical protein